jgi:hypothetical protein
MRWVYCWDDLAAYRDALTARHAAAQQPTVTKPHRVGHSAPATRPQGAGSPPDEPAAAPIWRCRGRPVGILMRHLTGIAHCVVLGPRASCPTGATALPARRKRPANLAEVLARQSYHTQIKEGAGPTAPPSDLPVPQDDHPMWMTTNFQNRP